MATLLHRRMSLVRFLLAAVLVASVLGGRVFPARAQAALSIVETGGDTAVVEGGAPDTYTVSLTSVPSAPVTVTATPASARLDLGEGPGVAAVHVFSVEAYDQPWEITVSAPDDAVVSGNVTVDITHVATGGGYDGVPAGTVVVAVQEDDEAGVTVQPAGLSVSEPDGSASLAISLTSQPTENVAIPVSAASDEIEVSPSTVTLTPDNWSAGATVAVTAVDDDVVDGTQAAQVTLGPAQSADAVYDGWAIPPVPVQVADDDVAGVDVDPQGITLTEGGPAAAYTLVLTGQPAGDVVVTATPGNADVRLDDAAAGAAVTRTFTTGNWATPQPVSVRAVDDAIAGGTRATTIVHAASGGGYGGVPIPSVGVTVEDDDSAGFLLSKTTLTVPEPAGSDSLSVALLSQPLAEVQVGVGTASDEIVVSPALLLFTWTNWEAGEAVLVGARDDDVVDGTQTAHLLMGPAVSDDGAYDGRTLPPVEVLVQDDDVPGVLVDPTGLTLSEPDGSAAITISLTSQPTDDVTIPVGVAGDEISVSDPSVTLTPGAWPAGATVTVHVVDDAVADGTQTDQVLLGPAESTDPNYSGWTIPPVAVQVQDDDAPGVTVSPTAIAVTEGGPTATYSLSLDSQPTGDVVITATPQSSQISLDGEAPGSLVTRTVTPQNWGSPQSIDVEAADDAIAETLLETAITHSASGGGYDGVSAAPVAVTVTDDDTAGVHVTPTVLTLSEPDGSEDLTITLTSQPTADVTIPVSTGSDEINVSPSTVTLTDSNWSTGVPVTVTASDDDIADGTRNAQVALGPAESADPLYDRKTLPTVSVQVDDDDVAGVLVQPQTLDIAEGGPQRTYTVVLTSEPTADVTITASDPGGQVMFVNGAARTFTSETWSTPQSIAVRAADDRVAEGSHEATITHAAAGDGYTAVEVPQVGVTIADNDEAGFRVEPAGLSVTEGGASKTLAVFLTSVPTEPVTIPVSAGSGRISVSPESVVLGVGNWDTGASVTVSAPDDDVAEATQSIEITLGPAQSDDTMYDGLSLESVSVEVQDDDVADVIVSRQAVDLLEGGAAIPYSLVLTSEPTDDVDITATPQSAEVRLVGASPGASLTRTFTPDNWGTPQSIEVLAEDDDVAGAARETTIVHTASGGGYGDVTIDAVTVRVADDDSPGIYVELTAETVSEPDGSTTITISLTSQPTDDVTIPVGVAGDEISVSVPSVTLTPGAWPAGATVTVHVVDDAVADGTQTAQVLLGPAESTDPNYSGWTIPPVAVQVQDDDAPGVTVSPTALNILEGDTGEYTVVLGSEPQGVVVLTVTPSARLSVDPGLIEFTEGNWTEPQTVTVTAVDNAWAEGKRLETIAHTVAGGEYDGVAVAPVEVTVTDDDTAGVHVTPTSLVLSEPDDTATVTITLTSGPRANVTVPVSTGSGEINVSPSTVTLTADRWNTGAEVTITVANDAIADGTQLAVVTLGPTQSADVMYQGLTLPIVQVDVTDDDVAGVLVDPEGVSVVEGGPPVTYTLALTSQPTADVTITASVAGGEVELVGDAARTFAPENWATPQEMAVRAVDDPFPDGHQVATVVHALAASGEYTGLEVAPVEVSVADNDRADVSIAPLSLRLVEGGAPGAYALSLTAPPEGAVAVDVQPDEGLDVGAGSGQTLRLVVPAEAWHLPQTVTVVAVDDDVAGDEREAWITHETTGGGYTDVAVERVRVVIEDHDRAGIRVVPAHIVVSEPNGTADLAISLATRPAAPVRIPLQATTDRCLVVPDLIDLNPWEWRDGETVTVRAVNDRVRTGDGACGIRVGPAVSGDRRYDGLTAPDVPVTVLDDEPEGPMSLPLLFLSQPAALGGPVLDPIANPDGDGTYEVTWSVAESAEVYLVEEASDPAFADSRLVYEGAEPRVAISDRGAGRLWYRARSRASWGELSGWSAPQYVDILWEREPNNAAHTEANGPLVPDLVYRGVVDGAGDPQDYFLIVLARDAALDVFLSDIPEGHNSDLVLRDAALGLVGYSGELGAADEHIATGALPAGRYYVQVYHRVVGGGSGAYTLRYTIR